MGTKSELAIRVVEFRIDGQTKGIYNLEIKNGDSTETFDIHEDDVYHFSLEDNTKDVEFFLKEKKTFGEKLRINMRMDMLSIPKGVDQPCEASITKGNHNIYLRLLVRATNFGVVPKGDSLYPEEPGQDTVLREQQAALEACNSITSSGSAAAGTPPASEGLRSQLPPPPPVPQAPPAVPPNPSHGQYGHPVYMPGAQGPMPPTHSSYPQAAYSPYPSAPQYNYPQGQRPPTAAPAPPLWQPQAAPPTPYHPTQLQQPYGTPPPVPHQHFYSGPPQPPPPAYASSPSPQQPQPQPPYTSSPAFHPAPMQSAPPAMAQQPPPHYAPFPNQPPPPPHPMQQYQAPNPQPSHPPPPTPPTAPNPGNAAAGPAQPIPGPLRPPAMNTSKRYEMLQQLGSGGQGGVWLVNLLHTGQAYSTPQSNPAAAERAALKVISCVSLEHANMALEEAKFLMKFDHPHIVGHRDFWLEQDGPKFNVCIAMQLCPNGDLTKYVQTYGRPTSQVAARWLYQIADAVGYLHERSIIHRDLKPQNVLLDEAMNCRLADLGLLRRVSHVDENIQTQVGTPMYLAPEILRQQNYDSKVDIWSLGCMLYTLTTGKARNINFEIYAHSSGPSHYLEELLWEMSEKGYSQPLVAVVGRCLSPSPNNRPTARAVMSELRSCGQA